MNVKMFNSFRLFRRAYIATRQEIFASLMILLVTTFCLTIVMWVAESADNGEYSFLDALVWVVAKYVEDPADITVAPITLLGRVIGTLVGVLGIAIFAVPAGLIGSGLLDAMSEEKHEQIIARHSVQLHKRFRRIAQSSSWFYNDKGGKTTLRYVPRYRTLEHVIVKTGMNNDDIIAAVNNCPDMRLMNMATTQRNEAKAKDELVVTHFPLNNEYGCVVDRGSDVTIVAPVAVSELGTGNFAFNIAAMGGFNYVSRELTPNPDDPFGFYTMQKSKLKLIGEHDMKEEVESQALHFMDDLKTLKKQSADRGRRHWFIFIMGTTKSLDYQMHLWRLATDNAELLSKQEVDGKIYGSTVVADDEAALQQIFNLAKERLSARNVELDGVRQPIALCMDNCNILKSVSSSNIMRRMGGGVDCNAFTLRVGYEILVYSNSQLLVAKDVADVIKGVLEPEREVSAEAKRCFLEEGDGFADSYGESKVFERDPEKLKKMIARKGREARRRFERYDLDGNLE